MNVSSSYSSIYKEATKVIRIQRNTTCCMYKYNGFRNHLHFSEYHSTKSDSLKQILPHIPFIQIQAHDTFEDSNLKIINYSHSKRNSSKQRQLLGLKNEFTQLFPYFMDQMIWDSKRNTSSLSGGYSILNSHDYKENRFTILGHIQPFLQYKRLSNINFNNIKRLGLLILSLIKALGTNTSSFTSTTTKDSKTYQLHQMFAKSLGVETEFLKSNHFIDGFSIITNDFLHAHKDVQNDCGQRDSTYSLNVTMDVTQGMIDNPNFKKVLKELGRCSLGNQITVSLMLYSRKCVGNHQQLHNNINLISQDNTNPLVPLIVKALLQVDSTSNYNRLWDSGTTFLDTAKWKYPPQRNPNSEISMQYIQTTACYDKMVCRLSFLKCIDLLHSAYILPMFKYLNFIVLLVYGS